MTLACSKSSCAYVLTYLHTINFKIFRQIHYFIIKDDSKESKKSLGSLSGDASAEEDAILEELAMISRNPPPPNEEEDEERDSFHLEDMPSPLSLVSNKCWTYLPEWLSCTVARV